MGYTGSSIVEYLKSTGAATDYASRTKLAAEKGITGYTGTAQQNTQLLNMLRGSGSSNAPAPTSVSSVPSVQPLKLGAGGIPGTVADNNMNYGGWYDNSDSGKNQRYWGNGVWTDGEEPGLPTKSEEVTGYLNNYQNSILNKSMPEVREMIAGGAEKPALLNRTQDFEDLRATYGVSDLETTLNDLKAQEDQEVAAFRQQRFDEQGKPVATNVIAGRIGKEEQAANERLDFIGRQKARVVDELNTKYSIIGQIMQFKSLDYADAVSAYETEFSQNMAVYNLMSTEQNRAEDVARANLQIFMTAATKGNLDYASLPADQKVMINKLEAQAGLPVGFTSSLKLDPGANVLFTTSYEGVTQVGVRNADGTISVESYGTRIAGKATDSDKLKMASSEMTQFLSGNANSYGHIDGTTYIYARKKWVEGTGGTTDDFDKMFRDYRDPYNLDQYHLPYNEASR